MIPALLAGLALASLVAVAALLRTLGPRYRVGRLLAATPLVTIEEAIVLARDERRTYVRVNGRISSDEEFPDEHDRPLVYRRSRIALRDPAGRWTTHVDEREAVPFGVESRSAFIAVDETALAVGLVVIPREAAGVARDLPADLATALPRGHQPRAPARLTIEQLSAVEHATVCGRPQMRADRPSMGAGAGRPLIVTTLELPAAMRLLARDHRGRVVVAFVLLLVGLGLGAGSVVALLTAV